jgi:protein-L-isoaspartate(D-aspartate) O-methyltransferase
MSRLGRTPLARGLRRLLGALLVVATPGCSGADDTSDDAAVAGAADERPDPDPSIDRDQMVVDQIEARGVGDPRVLAAMRRVPRHRYAPDVDPGAAYADRPHPIGLGQTISQPYIVALMTELAALEPPCKVLEVGTGSGYQAAVLAEVGCRVYSIEIIAPLAHEAAARLDAEGYGDRIEVRAGDGYLGWPEHAPFDAILVTAAAPRVPRPLLEQLRVGGRLVIPVGDLSQILEVHRRTEDGFVRERKLPVRFVPMTGEVRSGED